MALASRVALVTGAASGLGRATALRLARMGARVALLDLPSTKVMDVEKEIGDSAVAVPADVTSPDEVRYSGKNEFVCPLHVSRGGAKRLRRRI